MTSRVYLRATDLGRWMVPTNIFLAATRLVVGATFAIGMNVAAAATPARPMMEFEFGEQRMEATPLRTIGSRIELLGRDGRLWDLDSHAIHHWRKLPMEFRSSSASDLRAALERECDGVLEVGGSGHFVLAYPQGQGKIWNSRFEELFRSFTHYFSVRGFAVRQPTFPLIAVIWPSKAEFLFHARENGDTVPPNVLGYYSPRTNRVSLYDSEGLRQGDWGQNAKVIIHEATHQTAFNTGVHNRFCQPPRWLAEGLGMLFEAPGIWDSERYRQFADRVNRERLGEFRRFQGQGRKPQTWRELVAGDTMFGSNVNLAYAESWAFSFFLVETEPSKYCALMKRTADRPDFSTYSAAERTADFKAIFGDNYTMLEANFLRFIAAIR